MPSLAFTPRGTPTTLSAGPSGALAVLLAEAAGTVALTARPGDEITTGLVAPCASGTTADEHPAVSPPVASATPAIINRTTRRM